MRLGFMRRKNPLKPAMDMFQLRLPRELVRQLQTAAKKELSTASEVARRGIARELDALPLDRTRAAAELEEK